MAKYYESGVIFGKNNEQGEILVKVEYDEAAEQVYITTKVVVGSGVYCMESEVFKGSEREANEMYKGDRTGKWTSITQAEWDSHTCTKRMKRDSSGMLTEA